MKWTDHLDAALNAEVYERVRRILRNVSGELVVHAAEARGAATKKAYRKAMKIINEFKP